MLIFIISVLCINAMPSGGSEEEACMKALQAFSIQAGVHQEFRSIEKLVEQKARKTVSDDRVWTAAGIAYVFVKKREVIYSFRADPFIDSIGVRAKVKARQNRAMIAFRWDF